MPSTIIIADDHALSTEGTKSILSTDDQLSIIGQADNGISAIAMIRKYKPSCAIIDLAMPGANGLEVLIEAKRWSPDTKVIVVTGNYSAQQFRQLKEADVDAILLKNSAPEDIITCVISVLKGKRIFAGEVEQVIAEEDQRPALSKREYEVLMGISRGLSNTKISQELGVSPKTVDTHRTNLMRKFGVNSVATLLVKAMKDGFLEP